MDIDNKITVKNGFLYLFYNVTTVIAFTFLMKFIGFSKPEFLNFQYLYTYPTVIIIVIICLVIFLLYHFSKKYRFLLSLFVGFFIFIFFIKPSSENKYISNNAVTPPQSNYSSSQEKDLKNSLDKQINLIQKKLIALNERLKKNPIHESVEIDGLYKEIKEIKSKISDLHNIINKDNILTYYEKDILLNTLTSLTKQTETNYKSLLKLNIVVYEEKIRQKIEKKLNYKFEKIYRCEGYETFPNQNYYVKKYGILSKIFVSKLINISPEKLEIECNQTSTYSNGQYYERAYKIIEKNEIDAFEKYIQLLNEVQQKNIIELYKLHCGDCKWGSYLISTASMQIANTYCKNSSSKLYKMQRKNSMCFDEPPLLFQTSDIPCRDTENIAFIWLKPEDFYFEEIKTNYNPPKRHKIKYIN